MRLPILTIAIPLTLAASCSAFAEEKKHIEIQDYGFGVSMPVTTSRNSSPTYTTQEPGGTSKNNPSQFKKLGIFKSTHDKREAGSQNILTNKGSTTTNTPSALKSQNLLGGTSSGPTSGRMTIKVSPEYTRH